MRCDALGKATGLALCLGVLSVALVVSGCGSQGGAPTGGGSGQRQFKIAYWQATRRLTAGCSPIRCR
jgi:hypothetical protein